MRTPIRSETFAFLLYCLMARRLMPWRRKAERSALGFTPSVPAMSFVRRVASAETISVSSPAVHRRRPSLEIGGIGRDAVLKCGG